MAARLIDLKHARIIGTPDEVARFMGITNSRDAASVVDAKFATIIVLNSADVEALRGTLTTTAAKKRK